MIAGDNTPAFLSNFLGQLGNSSTKCNIYSLFYTRGRPIYDRKGNKITWRFSHSLYECKPGRKKKKGRDGWVRGVRKERERYLTTLLRRLLNCVVRFVGLRPCFVYMFFTFFHRFFHSYWRFFPQFRAFSVSVLTHCTFQIRTVDFQGFRSGAAHP